MPTAFLFVIMCAASLLAAASETTTRPTATSATTQSVGKLDGYRLSPDVFPEGVVDEAGYRTHLAAEADRLERDASAAVAPLIRVQLLLTLANHRLSHQASESLTALMLDQATEAQRKSLHALALKAVRTIEDAQGAIEALYDDDETPRPESLDRLSTAADALGGFAHMLAAITRESSGDDIRAVKLAMVKLASVLESDHPEIAATARLCQALGLRASGQFDDGLAVMDPVLDRPKVLPTEFFGRLLRCRLLADRGSPGVAIGLALRLEEQTTDWFKQKAQSDEARRSVAVVTADLAADWADKLRADGVNERAVWADSLADRARASTADGDTRTLFRFSPAVPVLVTPPKGGRVQFFSQSDYVRSVVLVLDRPDSLADDFGTLVAEAKHCVTNLNEDQAFQLVLLGADGVEQIGDGSLLAATESNRRRAVDLLDAASTVTGTQAAEALQKVMSLEAERVFLFTASAVDDGLVKRVKAWNDPPKTAVDVFTIEGMSDAAALERLASEHRGRFTLLPTPLPEPGVLPEPAGVGKGK
jgi:hypothetical protein